jgi:hypothetical protein
LRALRLGVNVKLSDEDVTSFQRFAHYVRASLPHVASVALIEQNMKKFGSLSRSEFRQAMAWGSEPLIVIADLTDIGTCG